MEFGVLFQYLHQLAPDFNVENGVNFFSFQNEFGNISKIGVCIDPTVDNIKAATNQGIELLISYHPWYREAESLVKSKGLRILSLHTDWDFIPEGVGFTLAKAIGLKYPERIDEIIYGEAGITFRELAERCQRALDLNVMPYFGELKTMVNKIAIWPGPGFLPFNRNIWETCYHQGCDTILSGEFTIPSLRFASVHKLKIVDLGHSAVAKPAMAHLAYLLRNHLAGECSVEFFHDFYACNYNTSWFFPENGDTEESLPLFAVTTGLE